MKVAGRDTLPIRIGRADAPLLAGRGRKSIPPHPPIPVETLVLKDHAPWVRVKVLRTPTVSLIGIELCQSDRVAKDD